MPVPRNTASKPVSRVDALRPSDVMRAELLAQGAYAVPDSRGMIKLDAMENPYHWPAEMQAQLGQVLAQAELNRYPDPRAETLAQQLRTVMGVPESAGLMLGNGSDELIQILLMAVAGSGRGVLAPEPSFVMYRLIAQWLNVPYTGVALRPDFSLDMPAMLAAMRDQAPAVTFLAWPNNPTGNRWPRADVEALIEAAPGLVVADEAYGPFADDSFLSEVGQGKLMVMRTVSKLGLAGLRLGYLAGPDEWIRALDALRLPYNINVLTQAAASFALEHYAVLQEQAGLIRAERAGLSAALAAFPGVEVFPSEANFLLLRVPPGRADAVFEGLRERRILIKNVSKQSPLLADCLRVTVGTPEENAAFLAAFKQSL